MKFKREVIASFQEQDCSLSLSEGLEEFYSVNQHMFQKPKPTNPWNELLVHHDVCHVFFGVNTTIVDETAGDLWTLLGTDMTLQDYGQYVKTPEAKQLIKDIGFFHLSLSFLYLIPLSGRIYHKTRQMHKKWAFRAYQPYLNEKISNIRHEFNLSIL